VRKGYGVPLWRDLLIRFRELQPPDSDGLSATWDEDFREWELQDTPSDSVLRRFKSAAEQAASKRDKGRSWPGFLSLLKDQEHTFHEAEGGSGDGCIPRVCEAAADYCESQLHYDIDPSVAQRLEEFRHSRIMRAFSPTPETKTTTEEPPPSEPPRAEAIASQIDRLREECHWTMETLAAKTGLSVRSVQRHLSGDAKPYERNIPAYERAFSKQLKRDVVIRQMS
jgi:ribosome-binding protein aMBF1 (putative translation factor)